MQDKETRDENKQPTRKDSGHDFYDNVRNSPDVITDTLKPPPREDRRESNNDSDQQE